MVEISSARQSANLTDTQPKTQPKSLPEVPWVEIYKDMHVFETSHGCLVSYTEGMVFVPGATVASLGGGKDKY